MIRCCDSSRAINEPDYDHLGIAQPDRAAHKTRANILFYDGLRLPNALLIIIAEYGSSHIIKFTLTYPNNAVKCIMASADKLIISPPIPARFHVFANIKILATILTDNDGYIDMLSDYTWRKRYKSLREIWRSESTLPVDACVIFSNFNYGVRHSLDKYLISITLDPRVF